MTRTKKIVLVLAILLLAIVFYSLTSGLDAFSNQRAQETNAVFVSTDWEDQYQRQSVNPKGLHFFYRIVAKHVDATHRFTSLDRSNDLKKACEKPATFVFVGEEMGIKKGELRQLLRNIYSGGMLFLSMKNCTDDIAKIIFSHVSPTPPSIVHDYASQITVQCEKKSFQIVSREEDAYKAQEWVLLQPISPWNKQTEVFSKIQGFANGLLMNYGKGRLLVHTTPEAFFNFQLIQQEPFEYAKKVLNKIPKNQNVHVLDFVQYDSDYQSSAEGDAKATPSKSQEFSFLLLIVKNPYLRGAAFLLLIALILIMFFRIGRSQPLVPLLPEKRNRTREFAQTIAALYISKGRPRNIVELQRSNFMYAIQKHFYIDLFDVPDRKTQLARLKEKSGATIESVEILLLQFEKLDNDRTSIRQVMELFGQIRKVYTEIGIQQGSKKVSHVKQQIAIPFNAKTNKIFLFSGFVITCAGLYFLTVATPFGALFCLAGATLVIVGGWRFAHPEVLLSSESVLLNHIYRPARQVKWKDILVENQKKNESITLRIRSRRIPISLSDLTPSERVLVEQLVKNKSKLEEHG